MSWRPKAGGWSARRSAGGSSSSSDAASSSARTSRVERGEILRTSSQGFGFIGDGPTARKRYYFHFKDVEGNAGPSLVVGQQVQYQTRMNDESMELEACAIVPTSGGGRESSGSIRSRMTGAGSGGGSSGSSSGRSSRSRFGGGSSGSGGGKNRFANLSKNVSSTSQRTKEGRDQYGEKRAVDSGSLLGIIGHDGEVAASVMAKGWEDYGWNPDGGLGFFRWYQEGRGRVYVPPPPRDAAGSAGAAGAAGSGGDPYDPSSRPPAPPTKSSWASRKAGSKGRSLADLMPTDG